MGQLFAEYGADAQRYSVRREVLHAVRPTGAVGRLGSRVCFAGNPDHGHSRISMTQDKYMARGRVHTAVADLLDRTINDE